MLENCIARGLALELNTWSVRRGTRCITPAPEILRWYREMGGERVTLGSDAHQPERVAEDFRLMRSIGVNTIRVYYVPPKWFLDTAARAGAHDN